MSHNSSSGSSGNNRKRQGEPLAIKRKSPVARKTPDDDIKEEATEVWETQVVPDIEISQIWKYVADTAGDIKMMHLFMRRDGKFDPKYTYTVSLFINYVEACGLTAGDIPKNQKYGFLKLLESIRDGEATINGVATPYTPNIKERARVLHEIYSVEGMVNDVGSHDPNVEEDAGEPSSSHHSGGGGGNRSVASTKGKNTAKKAGLPGGRHIVYPRRTHPIFGDNGPMRGITYSVNMQNKGRSYVLNSMYASERRNPNVPGSNGIAPSTWYPFQICALFHGAHGSRMGGIAGDIKYGAYSIVVSGLYSDLDEDNGDTLWYSGSGSHDNVGPTPKLTAATGLLVTSRQTRNLVRVLRSASSGGQNHKWLPRGGLRYDGLYQVVGQEIRMNKNNGAFYQFKLVRRDTWPIDRYVPSQQQLTQLAAIKSAYI